MTTAITITKVTKRFGSKRALDDVSLSIPQGHIFGFLGPNGAGKTTMIRCLMDYIQASDGNISILGRDAHTDSAPLKQQIGYLSSDIQLHPNWSARTHIDFMASIKGRGKADSMVKQFKLDLKPKVRNLSSGNKQKLAIILAFLGDPQILVMDEPTRGLDPLLKNELYTLLREFARDGGTIFFSSHNLAEVQQLCDSVAVIRDGKIVAAEAMKDILKIQIHLVRAVSTTPFNYRSFQIRGVKVVEEGEKQVTLKVHGKIDPIIKLLSRYSLVDLEVTHASLEDIFMEYY